MDVQKRVNALLTFHNSLQPDKPATDLDQIPQAKLQVYLLLEDKALWTPYVVEQFKAGKEHRRIARFTGLTHSVVRGIGKSSGFMK